MGKVVVDAGLESRVAIACQRFKIVAIEVIVVLKNDAKQLCLRTLAERMSGRVPTKLAERPGAMSLTVVDTVTCKVAFEVRELHCSPANLSMPTVADNSERVPP